MFLPNLFPLPDGTPLTKSYYWQKAKPMELPAPFMIAAMAYGAVSKGVKLALAHASLAVVQLLTRVKVAYRKKEKLPKLYVVQYNLLVGETP